MKLASGEASSVLEVRRGRASSVIVQRIPHDSAEQFMQWQRGISAEAATFPGYQTTELFPAANEQEEWVAIIHFDDSETLQAWLDSPQRARWIAKLPCETRDFRLKMLPSGFGSWFAGLSNEGQPLPHWKMALTVLFGLYPTVMFLAIFLWPHTQHLGSAVAFLINNMISISFLEWLGMPVISRVLAPWLHANGKEQRALSLGGLILIVGALGVMVFLFRMVT